MRFGTALDCGDEEAADAVLLPLVRRLDTTALRAQLARAVVAPRDADEIDALVVGVALADLGSSSTVLVRASVVQALLVSIDAAPTPSGLVVASA